MSVILMIFLVLSILGMSLYTTDALHKMRDDVRTIKIRTGKVIQLLDAVLSKDCAAVGDGAKAAAAVKVSDAKPADVDEGNTDNEDSYVNAILARLSSKDT